MGFFSVTNRKVAAKFCVKACHLSFWALGKSPLQGFGYNYFFDVGLRIVSESELRRLRITLPFDTEVGDLTDLSEIALDPNFAPLIFGRPVSVDGSRVRYDGTAIGQDQISDRVIAVSETNSTPDRESTSDVDFSSWTIELQDEVGPEEAIYIRFRFRVRDPKRVWASKGWGFAKRGVIADFRIADIRESVLLGEGSRESGHIQTIDNLFLFVVAPAHYVPRHVSPALHYSRLLEPKVWNRYLASCGRYDHGTKFSIHQWRSLNTEKKKPVSVQDPFRAYADFSNEFGKELLFYYVIFAVVTALVIRAATLALEWLFPSIMPTP